MAKAIQTASRCGNRHKSPHLYLFERKEALADVYVRALIPTQRRRKTMSIFASKRENDELFRIHMKGLSNEVYIFVYSNLSLHSPNVVCVTKRQRKSKRDAFVVNTVCFDIGSCMKKKKFLVTSISGFEYRKYRHKG